MASNTAVDLVRSRLGLPARSGREPVLLP